LWFKSVQEALPEATSWIVAQRGRAQIRERNASRPANTHRVPISHFPVLHRDFLAHASSLIQYGNRDRTEPIPQDLKVRLLGYDCTVNQRLVPGLWFRPPVLAVAAEIYPGK